MFSNLNITLASASPRRRELLAGLNVSFTVEPAKDEKETYTDDMPWQEIPEFLARHKSESFHRELEPGEILITADTLVFLPEGEDMRILGKPADRDEALGMLRELCGHTHLVLTGVCVRSLEKTVSFTDTTEVDVNDLSDEEIEYYVDQYRPYDKAGAYGVQEWFGYASIGTIRGSFYNVMGLPVHKLYEALKSFAG
ncbi:MAG: septum formation protein Maf [Bacteroidales bacterium]|nr:septum formation protein Maf [Bacteroidales bacterium]